LVQRPLHRIRPCKEGASYLATPLGPFHPGVAAKIGLARLPEGSAGHWQSDRGKSRASSGDSGCVGRLGAAGFEVEAKLYSGLGHVFSAEGVQTAGKFFARQLVHGL
jgi:hypothetical protein